MFLVPINIPTFRFSPSKIFLQLLVPIKFSITTFSPYFEVNFCIYLMKLCIRLGCCCCCNEIVQKCVVYCKNISQKKLEFFNKT